MKKITCMLLLIHGGFMIAQTKTVVTPNGEKVTISPFANNGLSQNNGFTQLGGALTKASVLTTTSSNTLAIQGLQAGAATDNVLVNDSNGVLKYVPRASFTGADNLGNHIATMDLNMSNKNITNIFNAYIKNEAQIADRVTSNTNYFGIYKNNGLFGIWNNIKSTNALTIDETTNKTTLTSAQIAKGTDGGLPQPNYIATSIDGAGNIKWQNPATLPGLISGTEWYLGSTTTDATDNKTGSIYRTGKVGIGTNNPDTVLDVNSGGTASNIIPALKIADGTQGADKVLTSDANGVARWEAAGVTLATGTLGAGINLANNLTGPSAYAYTGSSVTLPPGKWLVTVNMILTKPGNPILGSTESWWVRSTFSNGPSTFSPSGDIQGTNKLISGALTPSSNYGLLNGSVIILNSSSTSKTYYYIAGYLDGQNRTGTLSYFGGAPYGENSIIYQSVH